MFANIKDKFKNFGDKPFRQYQEEAIRFIQESTKPICVIQAPTGAGKSLIGMCAGAAFGIIQTTSITIAP
jgi:CRISPR/Cas system-associated endonuclease/helicase Cas3